MFSTDSPPSGGIPSFPCYRTVEETYESARLLALNNPEIVSWINIGKSTEKENSDSASGTGYDMFALKIANEGGGDRDISSKPVFLATCAIHAREYPTAELCTRFAEYLVNGYDTNPDITTLIDHHEIHFILQANPDGRKMAEDGELWRKNTNSAYLEQIGGVESCFNFFEDDGFSGHGIGVDLNRNFPFHWKGVPDTPPNPPLPPSECFSKYPGPESESESETQAIMNYARKIFPDSQRIQNSEVNPYPGDATGVALDIHSYGEYVVFPWSFTVSKHAPRQGYFDSFD